jgi:hypothetical protein
MTHPRLARSGAMNYCTSHGMQEARGSSPLSSTAGNSIISNVEPMTATLIEGKPVPPRRALDQQESDDHPRQPSHEEHVGVQEAMSLELRLTFCLVILSAAQRVRGGA